MITFNYSNVCISAKILDRAIFYIKMTPDVRLIMPCTQLNLSNPDLRSLLLSRLTYTHIKHHIVRRYSTK